MNKRLALMMQKIAQAEKGGGTSLDELADEFGVSERTVRSDMTEINRFLRSQQIQAIRIDRDGTIRWSEGHALALERLRRQSFYDYKLTGSERRAIALAMLAVTDGYLTLAEMADAMFVSRSTMINDLDAIKDAANTLGINLRSMASRGLHLDVSEQQRRVLLLKIEQEEPIAYAQWNASRGVGSREEEQVIRSVLAEQAHAHGFELDGRSFARIQNYLCVAVERCRDGHPIILTGDSAADNPSRFAADVVRLVSQYTGVRPSKGEALELDRLMRSCNLFPKDQFRFEDMQVQQMTRRFIAAISTTMGIDLNGDYELFEFLSNHLELMDGGSPTDLADAAHLSEVIDDQPQVLEAIECHLDIIADYYGRPITTTEAIYIALHVCASLERQRNRRSRVRVLVASDLGTGVGQLISETLIGRFDVKVVGMVPAHELPYFYPDAADLVVTTAPGTGCRIEQFVVSDVPTEQELVRLGQRLDVMRRSSSLKMSRGNPVQEAQALIERFRPIVSRWMSDDADGLIRDLSVETRRFFREAESIEQELISPRLHQLLTASHIQLDVTCDNWESAIRSSVGPLIEEGYIDESYVDAMVDLVRQHGPYIVFVPGLAVAHADPDSGAHRLGMNIIRLKEPIPFGSGGFDPVEFVCTLAVVDRKSHLKSLFNLQTMLANEEFRGALRKAKTPDEFWRVLERYESQLPN